MPALTSPTDAHTSQGAFPSTRRPEAPCPVTFDGIICFGGEDWWYHNRGHFDMQMMRELSGHVPVLYVNSIGMRVPRVAEGRMFFKRVARKLRSLRRGLVFVRPQFAVFSPLAGPGKLGRFVARAALPRQLRRAARRMGMSRPLLWIACPPGAAYLGALGSVGAVYQRTDRYETFTGVDPQEIAGYDAALKRQCAVTVYCSRSLMQDEAGQSARQIFVDHGVDYDYFAAAGESGREPEDVRDLPRPRIGFVGGIDAHTFDPPLLAEVARRMPDAQFVLVGACSLPADWNPPENVRLLGQRPYDQVASYMAAADALIMPWNNSPWIKACNPVKMKEYLAVGRPIVSTPFDELAHYREHIVQARGPEEFVAALRACLADPGDPDSRRRRVEHETWSAKCERVLTELAECGLRPAERAP